MDDRYLWDRTGPADPEIARLEDLLSRFRGSRPPLRLPADVPSHRRRMRVLLAAAALVAGVGVLWMARWGKSPEWRVERLAGQPSIGPVRVSGITTLRVGQRIETDAGSRAKIGIGRIAEVAVGPGSRLRLVRSGPAEQRLALDRGIISARISAPPRLFLVETPSALAVDLGCAYTLEVDDAGAGLLRVEKGWVNFERRGRESIVPAGAACATRVREGPGTPYYEDAPAELRRALEAYDFEGGGPDALSGVLAAARRRDGLTLWHLLGRSSGPDRERVYERLAELVAPPRTVTREGALRGDRAMLERWRWELEGMPLLPRQGTFWSFWRRVWFRLANG